MKKAFFASALLFLVGACSSEPVSYSPLSTANINKKLADDPAVAHPGTPLAPHALVYSAKTAAIIRYVVPGKAAARAGLAVGDQLVRINGKKLFSAMEFEYALRHAPKRTSLTVRRGDSYKMLSLDLEDGAPRLGAEFEPDSVAIVRQSSPNIAYMHVKDMTVYAETSLNDVKKEIHLNLIVKSSKPVPSTKMSFLVSEKGQLAPLAKGTEKIDALGTMPHFVKRVIHKDGDLKGPLLVSLNIDRRHFQFEFK